MLIDLEQNAREAELQKGFRGEGHKQAYIERKAVILHRVLSHLVTELETIERLEGEELLRSPKATAKHLLPRLKAVRALFNEYRSLQCGQFGEFLFKYQRTPFVSMVGQPEKIVEKPVVGPPQEPKTDPYQEFEEALRQKRIRRRIVRDSAIRTRRRAR